MGGSDFHGIDPNTERAPGAIPFPRKQVEAFLAHAKSTWERPMRERLHEMVALVKQQQQTQPQDEDAEPLVPEELLIWKEQLPAAQQVCAALGADVGILEDADSPSQYRTLRVQVPATPVA